MKLRILPALLATALLLVGLLSHETFAAEKAANQKREKLISRLDSCEAVLQEFMATPKTAIPRSILQKAKGIVIVNEFQVGVGIGGKGGYGIVMVRRNDGHWSIPCFLSSGEASLGIQLGAHSATAIFVLMDDEAARLLFQSRFNFGAQANVIGGPDEVGAQEASQIIKASVYVYTKNRGFYAGAKLKSGWLSPNNRDNRFFYGLDHSMPELLYGNLATARPETRPLIDYVERLSGN